MNAPSSSLRSPNEKFLLGLEAAKSSLLAAEFLLNRIKAELDDGTLAIDRNQPVPELQAAMPFISSAAFIDFAFRFKSLIQGLPLISSRKPELRNFHSKLKLVIDVRNHLQHLRTELASNDAIDYPLLGSLSWVRNNQVYAMSFATQLHNPSFASISYDSLEGVWTATHVYAVKGMGINLDRTLQEMQKVFAWITSIVQTNRPEVLELKWGQAIAFKMAFVQTKDGIEAVF